MARVSVQVVYVLYALPLEPAAVLDLMDVAPLDTANGWALIDEALKIVGVKRLGAAEMVKTLLDELLPEEDI